MGVFCGLLFLRATRRPLFVAKVPPAPRLPPHELRSRQKRFPSPCATYTQASFPVNSCPTPTGKIAVPGNSVAGSRCGAPKRAYLPVRTCDGILPALTRRTPFLRSIRFEVAFFSDCVRHGGDSPSQTLLSATFMYFLSSPPLPSFRYVFNPLWQRVSTILTTILIPQDEIDSFKVGL